MDLAYEPNSIGLLVPENKEGTTPEADGKIDRAFSDQ
jgi:hypothetical protein